MEKRTIGSFMAALRKANGMTQKELAERLNVSDKSVSRWERDDGAPDLSLIPVIAEIFGVTCDELLRGERRPAEERGGMAPTEEGATPKGEKERKRLLAVSLSKYKARTFVAMGVALMGLIAAMVGNFGFLRAYVGFLVGAVFYLASVVCQAVFINSALLSVADDSLPAQEVGEFKWSVVRLGEWSVGLTAVLLGFSLPLVIVPSDAYVGVSAGYWFAGGGLLAALALLVVWAVCWFLNDALLKGEVCRLSEREEKVYHHNHALKRRCVQRLAAALAVTLVVHAFGFEVLWSTQQLMEGVTFHDYESFVAYMEQDIPYESTYQYWGYAPQVDTPIPANPPDTPSEVVYYDEEGNVISEEEARRRTLEDIDGNVVCEYIDRNESVSSIRYSPKEGTVLPITVFTDGEYREARRKSEFIGAAFCILYPLELAAALVYYRKGRR